MYRTSRIIRFLRQNGHFPMERHQRIHQPLIGARAHAEYRRLVPTFGGDVCMPHVAVEINGLSDIENDGAIELGKDLDGAFEDVNVLLAGMTDEIAKLLRALGADTR